MFLLMVNEHSQNLNTHASKYFYCQILAIHTKINTLVIKLNAIFVINITITSRFE